MVIIPLCAYVAPCICSDVLSALVLLGWRAVFVGVFPGRVSLPRHRVAFPLMTETVTLDPSFRTRRAVMILDHISHEI